MDTASDRSSISSIIETTVEPRLLVEAATRAGSTATSAVGAPLMDETFPTARDVALTANDSDRPTMLPPWVAPPPYEGTRRRWYLPIKFTVEWMLAAAIAIASLPIVFVCCLLVRLGSPGPSIYRQERVGRWGRTYTIFKIRTMRRDSESTTGAVWATANDHRITPFGHFLRDTHLDELPQVWNILLGEMSLIGPRPERPEIVAKLERVIPYYADRQRARPGVTGLAQMRLPADQTIDDVKRKVAHDLFYIAELNPLLDIRLGLATASYFFSAACKAICDALVGKYARAVERDYSPITSQTLPTE